MCAITMSGNKQTPMSYPIHPLLQPQKLCGGFLLGISHSGQKTNNPLLLLGQYSDDELEDSVERVNDANADSSLANNNMQDEGSPHGGHQDLNVKSDSDTLMQTIDQQRTETDSCAPDILANKEGGEVTVSDPTASVGQLKQSDSSLQASGTMSSELHATTDVSSQWKMILHEESNQYYYWNTETGETSWEVPDVLAQTAGMACNQKTYATGYSESGPMNAFRSNLELNVEQSPSLPVQNIVTVPDSLTSQKTVDGIEHQTDLLNDGYKIEDIKGDQSEGQRTSADNSIPCHKELACPENSSEYALSNSDNGAATDLPAHLLGQSERLLEKVRSLEKSHGNLSIHKQISKYILEVEVRHSDIKALISDASSLLLFWLHTEKQLNRLEDSINNEIYELAKSAVMDDIAATNRNPPEEKEKSDDSIGSELEDRRGEGEIAHSGKAPNANELVGVDGGGFGSHYGRDSVGESDVNASDKMFQNISLPVVEDVDMDVDMEVEESVPTPAVPPIDASGGNILGQTEQSNLHTDATVPPPPGEEWIPPPPPPDSEEVPPPPPDTGNEAIPPLPPDNGQVPPHPACELQGLSYMPPQSYAQQSAAYATQYNLSYPGTNYQYYGNVVAQIPNSQFYGPIDGSQVSLPHSSYYYGTLSGTSSESAPGTANGVEAYYNFKEGTTPLFPVVSSVESSVQHTSGSINDSAVNVQPTDASAVLDPSSTVNNHIVGGSTKMLSSGTPSTSSITREKESFPVSSQSTDVVMGLISDSTVSVKGQSKVTRPKKRSVAVASTLRTNKKVSSMVDKWKAVKEELNESEEEEPENPHEILDRKRQREIEEWKARQIASGEAKDNANFQPLGGDWREKVKRRRQQAAREAAESAAETKKDENQQPDLTRMSADLPSGWQAYWDESTKQVYYGNTITSQTTWTRPTR